MDREMEINSLWAMSEIVDFASDDDVNEQELNADNKLGSY